MQKLIANKFVTLIKFLLSDSAGAHVVWLEL